MRHDAAFGDRAGASLGFGGDADLAGLCDEPSWTHRRTSTVEKKVDEGAMAFVDAKLPEGAWRQHHHSAAYARACESFPDHRRDACVRSLAACATRDATRSVSRRSGLGDRPSANPCAIYAGSRSLLDAGCKATARGCENSRSPDPDDTVATARGWSQRPGACARPDFNIPLMRQVKTTRRLQRPYGDDLP